MKFLLTNVYLRNYTNYGGLTLKKWKTNIRSNCYEYSNFDLLQYMYKNNRSISFTHLIEACDNNQLYIVKWFRNNIARNHNNIELFYIEIALNLSIEDKNHEILEIINSYLTNSSEYNTIYINENNIRNIYSCNNIEIVMWIYNYIMNTEYEYMLDDDIIHKHLNKLFKKSSNNLESYHKKYEKYNKIPFDTWKTIATSDY